jgi:hypothetical protein
LFAPAAGPAISHTVVSVRKVGVLPAVTSRLSAVTLPDGRVLALGGLINGSSSDEILLGPPNRLRLVGHLPAPTHDAAAAPFGTKIGLFGGGEAVSTDAVTTIDPRTGRARRAGRLDEPLSDLGAVSVRGATYLVGGYTGTRYATAVLRVGRRLATTTVARLPAGLRYAGVAALGRTIYVAGGLSPGGETSNIYAVDPIAGTVRKLGRLPRPIAHAPLLAVAGALYLVGGTSPNGSDLRTIVRIDPRSGAARAAGSLPVALADAAAVSFPGKGIVLGGGTAAVYALTPG